MLERSCPPQRVAHRQNYLILSGACQKDISGNISVFRKRLLCFTDHCSSCFKTKWSSTVPVKAYKKVDAPLQQSKSVVKCDTFLASASSTPVDLRRQQLYPECASCAFGACHPDSSTHHFHKLFCHCKPNTRLLFPIVLLS